jgi:mannose-1-phosphate guanylyltransferase
VLSTDPAHLLTTIGVSDMIIVHTPDATLICPKSESQRVKDLVGKIKEKFGNKYQ